MGEELLPREIVWRKKTGFAVPVGEWSRQGLKEMAADCLGRASVERRGWLDAGVVGALLTKPKLGMFERRQFWTVFSLEMWARGVLGG